MQGMRVYRQSIRAASTFHDGIVVAGRVTARCAVISMRRITWQVAASNMTVNCKRCIAIRRAQQ